MPIRKAIPQARTLAYEAVAGMPRFIARAANRWSVHARDEQSCIVRTQATLTLRGPAVLLGVHLDTDLGWGWAPRGQRLDVNSTSPPLAKKLTCFGFQALGATDPVRIWTASWANAETTNPMPQKPRASYPDRRLLLVWDNVRYHHALAVRRCAAELGQGRAERRPSPTPPQGLLGPGGTESSGLNGGVV